MRNLLLFLATFLDRQEEGGESEASTEGEEEKMGRVRNVTIIIIMTAFIHHHHHHDYDKSDDQEARMRMVRSSPDGREGDSQSSDIR